MIHSVQIQNYKCFDTDIHAKFESGFNLVIGENNSGKSAFIEILSTHFLPRPHRSSRAIPNKGAAIEQVSSATFVTNANIEEFLRETSMDQKTCIIRIRKNALESTLEPNELLGKAHEAHFSFKREVSVNGSEKLSEGVLLAKDSISTSNVRIESYIATIDENRRIANLQKGSGGGLDLGVLLANFARSSIFKFSAERLNICKSKIDTVPILSPNAANLASVLHLLQESPIRFRRFQEAVKAVLPGIHWVSTRPVGASEVELRHWLQCPQDEREDLTVPLSECGTGVAQVLSILYVVITSDKPRTIIIDEPNSFLHPAAVRNLISILQEHSSHQFIISTHSASVISQLRDANLLQVKQAKLSGSHVVSIPNPEKELADIVIGLGVRSSDTFGADAILWVEGETEEILLPILMEKLGKAPFGRVVRKVTATGDFNAKLIKKVVEVYRSLSSSGSLLPKNISFLFDKERLSESDIEKLRENCGQTIHFLNRRTIENYLIHPAAIAQIVTECGATGWTSDRVCNWIVEHGTGSTIFRKTAGAGTRISPLENTDWRESVDAPRLLSSLFEEALPGLNYRKTNHSIRLGKWILDNDSSHLEPLIDELSVVLTRMNWFDPKRSSFPDASGDGN